MGKPPRAPIVRQDGGSVKVNIWDLCCQGGVLPMGVGLIRMGAMGGSVLPFVVEMEAAAPAVLVGAHA